MDPNFRIMDFHVKGFVDSVFRAEGIGEGVIRDELPSLPKQCWDKRDDIHARPRRGSQTQLQESIACLSTLFGTLYKHILHLSTLNLLTYDQHDVRESSRTKAPNPEKTNRSGCRCMSLYSSIHHTSLALDTSVSLGTAGMHNIVDLEASRN